MDEGRRERVRWRWHLVGYAAGLLCGLLCSDLNWFIWAWLWWLMGCGVCFCCAAEGVQGLR